MIPMLRACSFSDSGARIYCEDIENLELFLQLAVSKCRKYFLANQVNGRLLKRNLNKRPMIFNDY